MCVLFEGGALCENSMLLMKRRITIEPLRQWRKQKEMDRASRDDGAFSKWLRANGFLNSQSLIKTSLFAGGGLLIVYLSNELYSYFVPSKKDPRSRTKGKLNTDGLSIQELVDLTFPFSYMLTTVSSEKNEQQDDDRSKIRMNLDYIDDLLARLQKDTNECYVSVYESMMFNRIYRLLFSGDHVPTEREVHCSLWIVLHCLLRLCTFSGKNAKDTISSIMNIHSLFLHVFKLSDFYEFLSEAPMTNQKARVLFRSDQYSSDTFPVEALKYPVEIAWLAYAIVAHFYALNSSVLVRVKSIAKEEGVRAIDKNVALLQKNKPLIGMLTFETQKATLTKISMPIDKTGGAYSRNEVIVDSSSGEYAQRTFEQFLKYTNKFMNCDDASMVQLSLTSLGQICSSCNNDLLYYLLYVQKTVSVMQSFERLILCDDEKILQTLAKCLFSISMRDKGFLLNKLMASKTLLNEITYLATSAEIPEKETTNSYYVQTQYMNVLYLVILHSEPIAIQVMENPAINLLSCICAWLQLANSSQPLTFLQVTFSALQLLYGLCQHGPSTQKLVIDFYTKQKKTQDSLLFQQLRRLTFISVSPLIRYYSLLTWDTFVNGGTFRRFVTKNEQLINILMFVLKEEQEVVIKRLAVQIVRQLCRTPSIQEPTEDSRYELTLFLNHFNLLFEAIETLRYYMTFLSSHFDQQHKTPQPQTSTMEDRAQYVSDCLQQIGRASCRERVL